MNWTADTTRRCRCCYKTSLLASQLISLSRRDTWLEQTTLTSWAFASLRPCVRQFALQSRLVPSRTQASNATRGDAGSRRRGLTATRAHGDAGSRRKARPTAARRRLTALEKRRNTTGRLQVRTARRGTPLPSDQRSTRAMNRNGAPPTLLSAAMMVRAPPEGNATDARLIATFAARNAAAVPAGTTRTWYVPAGTER